MLENIRLSLRGILSHKLRSILTMLGVIIGIGSIVTIVSIVEGTNKNLEKSLVGAGNNIVTVSLCDEDGIPYYESSALSSPVYPVSEEQMSAINRIDYTEAATAYNIKQWADVYYKNISISGANIAGIDGNYLKTFDYYVSSGRNISNEEFNSFSKVALVSESLVSSAFGGEKAVGKIIEIQNEPFVVVGVVAEKNLQGKDEYESINDYYNDRYGSSSTAGVFIPAKTWPVVFGFDEPQSIAVKAKEASKMKSIGNAAADILIDNSKSEPLSYRPVNLEDSMKELKTLTNAIKAMLVSIANLSLLVGGIGVMNIMLVSVTERTSEIGLKKALGAKRRDILIQFLTESAVLTSLGGIIGTILGLFLSKLISFALSLPFVISIVWIIISILFSMAIGILFGAMPASRAAKLNPIDALRHE